MSAFLRSITLVLCLFALAACQEDSASDAESASIFPDLIGEQRAQCEKDGGRWGKAPGDGTFACFKTLSDANKPCSRESDCKGLCLARSRTCSPVTPFFGCNEVLGSNGLRQTRCLR